MVKKQEIEELEKRDAEGTREYPLRPVRSTSGRANKSGPMVIWLYSMSKPLSIR